MTISARQLIDGMIRRDISARQLAQQKGLTERAVKGWMRNGVPKKHLNTVKEFLDATEQHVHGAHHQDMFPTKDDVL